MFKFLSKTGFKKESRIKKFLKKPIIIFIITIFLIVGTVSAGYSYLKDNESEAEKIEEIIPKVETVKIDLSATNTSYIETVGTVNAETKVDVIALTHGTIKGIFFNVGDQVSMNKILVSLYDNSTLTSLNNANTNFINMQSNLSATERTTDESVRQAEIGVKAAQESIDAAEIGLQTARDNLANAKALKNKSNLDIKNNAIISFNNYLNTIYFTLDQVNYLLKAEGSDQLANVEHILGIKDLKSIQIAESDYFHTKDIYKPLSDIKLTTDNISGAMSEMSYALSITQQLVDDVNKVLDNTITSADFNDTMLQAQKTSFAAMRSTVVSSQTAAESAWQTLQNLDLVYNQEITALENAVKAAENQLTKAQTGLTNAETTLANVRRAKEQQILGAKSALDNAGGQLSLAQNQASDLSIKTPISGQITNKYIELGTEVSPGQKIAEISQTDTLKIEVSLASEDIYRIEKGETVNIGDNFVGTIDSIDPAADPITRKVKVEILFDNKNKDLIQGTFIGVKIPVKELKKTHEESVYIPLRAVTITQNESYVFTVVESTSTGSAQAKKIPVITGKTEGALIEIIDGLNTGDELIVEGGKSLEDGDMVEIGN